MPAQPTDWSSFIYPPQQSSPLINLNTQDAVNVSWSTPAANAQNFETLELIYWWSAPLNSPFGKIVNETAPLNGSRIFSIGYGLNFPAVGFFALFYLLPDGTVVNGPASLGFNVSNTDPSAAGRLWSQDGPETALTIPAAQSTISPSAPTVTVTASAQTPTASSADGLSGATVAGIVVGVAAGLFAIFVAVLFLMRRSWERQFNAGGHLGQAPPPLPEKERRAEQRSELPANQGRTFTA